MSNQPPPWSTMPGAPQGPDSPPDPPSPRVIDPTTGRPFGRLTLIQRTKLRSMNALIRPLLTKWLPRQLLKVLSAVAVTIGATGEQANQTALFLTAAAAWVLEVALSWLSVRWARRNASAKAPLNTTGKVNLLPLLLLGLALTLPALTACRATKPVGKALQTAAEKTMEAGLYPAAMVTRADLHPSVHFMLIVPALAVAVPPFVVAVPISMAGHLLDPDVPPTLAQRRAAQLESDQFEDWIKAGQEQANAEADDAERASLLLDR